MPPSTRIQLLSQLQEQAALAIALGANTTLAAKAAGVGRSTINTWLSQPYFVLRISQIVDARAPAALARMHARLISSLPNILDTHVARAALGNDRSAGVVLRMWNALEQLRANNAPPAPPPAVDRNYDEVEGVSVEVDYESNASGPDDAGAGPRDEPDEDRVPVLQRAPTVQDTTVLSEEPDGFAPTYSEKRA